MNPGSGPEITWLHKQNHMIAALNAENKKLKRMVLFYSILAGLQFGLLVALVV